jgi:hypothetical protein
MTFAQALHPTQSGRLVDLVENKPSAVDGTGEVLVDALAADEAGARYVVVGTGRCVTVIPAAGETIERRQEIRARSRMAQSPVDRRRALAWQIDGLE